jgi:hypothetical protein
MKASLAKKALLVVLGIFFLNKIADYFFWYSSIFWFDMFMHFLGGLFLTLLGGSLFSHIYQKSSALVIVLSVLAWVLLIGLGWEVFEFSVQEIVKVTGLADIPDSFSDLFFDLLGGLFGTLFVISAKKRYTTPHND